MNFYKALLYAGKDAQWLADKLRVSHQTIYNWKNGKSKPSPKRLKQLSKLLLIPIESLYREFY